MGALRPGGGERYNFRLQRADVLAAQAAASFTPPMVVSAITHSTGLPFGYFRVPMSSAAAFAMFIV